MRETNTRGHLDGMVNNLIKEGMFTKQNLNKDALSPFHFFELQKHCLFSNMGKFVVWLQTIDRVTIVMQLNATC